MNINLGSGKGTAAKQPWSNYIDEWIKCIDKGKMIENDFRKAFDLVDHTILLRKLSLYKFNQSAVRWFKSHLSYRQHNTESEKGLTDFTYVRSGVLQGCIIVPTLFLIFINELPLYFKHCSSDYYADDARQFTHTVIVSILLKTICHVNLEIHKLGVRKIICKFTLRKPHAC